MPQINFHTTVLCEDVRREAKGTAVIVGASPVGPPVMPETSRPIPKIAFYIEATIVGVTALTFRLFNIENDEQIFEEEITFDNVAALAQEDPDFELETTEVSLMLVFGKEDVIVKNPGLFSFQYLWGNEWKTIRTYEFPELRKFEGQELES